MLIEILVEKNERTITWSKCYRHARDSTTFANWIYLLYKKKKKKREEKKKKENKNKKKELYSYIRLDV